MIFYAIALNIASIFLLAIEVEVNQSKLTEKECTHIFWPFSLLAGVDRSMGLSPSISMIKDME